MSCDLGLARALDDVPSGLTTSRNNMGTIRHLSPELLEDDTPRQTLQSDTWAWGCVLAEVTCVLRPVLNRINAITYRLRPAGPHTQPLGMTLSSSAQSLKAKCLRLSKTP